MCENKHQNLVKTPEPEDDDEGADSFAVSLCNTYFSDDEE